MSKLWRLVAFDELSLEMLYDVLALRADVFVVEQNSAYLDPDGRDRQSRHLLCLDNGQLCAYQRCLPPGLAYPESSLGRIVVSASARGQGLGEALVMRGIEHNFSRWPDHDIKISAQAHLQEFYGALGFVAEGEIYLEDGIEHRAMRLHHEKHSIN